VQGRRSTLQALESEREQRARHGQPHDRRPVVAEAAMGRDENLGTITLSSACSGPVLTGSGDADVELTENLRGPEVVHITGNPESRYFSVRTLGTENILVMAIAPYHGFRLLDWDGCESEGFEIRATDA